MAEVKTWTVEEIEEARRGKCIHDGCPDFPAVCPHECSSRSANMLRAFAAQTRQVEAMREWLETERDTWRERRHTVEVKEFGHGVHAEAECALGKFTALFPKDGAQ